MPLRRSISWIACVATGIALPIAALASHGKAGLWEVTTRMDIPGMNAQIPTEALARMRAMGVQMPNGQTFTSRRCMTVAEVAAEGPPPMRNAQDCKMSNTTHDTHTFAADMICTGEMQGQGHFAVTYDSGEHYVGTYTFNGSSHGHPANVTNSFEGKWISADCGTVK